VRDALHGVTQFCYEYDFGDSWSHTVQIEAERPTPTSLRFAVCLDGQNACPPDDVGGTNRYETYLEALADRSHPMHEGFVERFGTESFDRTAFDLVQVNASLQRLSLRPRASNDR
jgi:hypothetical protein